MTIHLSKIYANDVRNNEAINQLLNSQGIRRDNNLDYTCALFDDDMNVIATGSYFENTFRCLAVESNHQGEGLINIIVNHLLELQILKGNTHVFLYTKCESAKFFSDLGFYEIAKANDKLVFMENQKKGFQHYLEELAINKKNGTNIAALVINANPFTLGHLYLVEEAAKNNDIVHLFMVSEDMSLIPYSVRKNLIKQGTLHLKNIIYHDTGPYIISKATFPSYFQKDEDEIIASQAFLDVSVFVKIAQYLGIKKRYFGAEPYSIVTSIYNKIMRNELPHYDIECIIKERIKSNSSFISASLVRQAIKDDNIKLLKHLVPETTLKYFLSEEANPIINKIKMAKDLSH